MASARRFFAFAGRFGGRCARIGQDVPQHPPDGAGACGIRGLLPEFRLEVDLADMPLRKEDGARRVVLDQGGVVRGHHHGAAAAGDLLEKLHDALGRHGVEVACRFVGQQHLRVVQDRAGDDQPLLLAPREFERHFVAFGPEVYELEHLVDPLPDLVFALPSRGFHHVIEVHEDVAVGEQLVVLEYDADPAAEVA